MKFKEGDEVVLAHWPINDFSMLYEHYDLDGFKDYSGLDIGSVGIITSNSDDRDYRINFGINSWRISHEYIEHSAAWKKKLAFDEQLRVLMGDENSENNA